MLSSVLVVVLLVVAYKAYVFLDLELRQRKMQARLVHKIPAWPLGLDTLYRINQLSKTFRNYEVFRDRHATYGKTYGMSLLTQSFVMTKDTENIKAVLATQFNDFGKGQYFIEKFGQFLGSGIFNADGEIWSHARSIMRPQFLKERVADLDNFENKMQRLFDLITPGEVVDIMDLWFRFTLDAATEHLFGSCADSLRATADENSFASAFAEIQELQTRRERHGPSWRWPIWRAENKRFVEVLAVLDEYVGRYVSLALDNEADEKDDSLLAALTKETRDPVFLRDSLVSALLAGRDTTAATLSWLIKELSKDPELYEDLRNETLDSLGEDGIPTYSQIKNLKLLQATINETLRVYPIVPFNIRTSLKDTTLPRGGGPDGLSPIFVPGGTSIVYSPLVMQRTQDIPDAEQWHPRRWIGDSGTEKYVPANWTYIPFNGGPRICLGQNFALTEIAYAMARILQRFKAVENCDEPLVGDDLGLRFDITLTPRHGVKARFIQ